MLARYALDKLDREADEEALQNALDHVAKRLDGSEDHLAVMIRLYALGWGHPEQRRRIELIVTGIDWDSELDTES